MAKRKKITKGTVSFILKVKKANLEELAPLYLRYSIYSSPKDYSLKKNILPLNWDDDDKEPTFISKPIAKKLDSSINYNQFCTSSEVNDIIALMNAVEVQIKDIEHVIELEGLELSSSFVVHKLKELRGDTTIEVSEKENDPIFTTYMYDFIQNNKGKKKASTLKVYGTVHNMVVAYEKSSLRQYKISEVDYDYIKGLCEYLVSLNCLNSTINRRIRHVKGFVKEAMKQGYTINNTYLNYNWSEDELEVLALTQEELKSIEDLDLCDNPRLEKVKDIFLFSCYTGLRHSDLKVLNKANIKGDFIKLTAVKTMALQAIPLIGKSRSLIDKYKSADSDLLFPVPSLQKINEYVKEVAKLSEIDSIVEKVRYSGAERIVTVAPKHDLVTIHCARRTFVTLSLELGMSAEEVMPITGHKDYKNFKRYHHLTEKRAKEAILQAWES
ncbi:site-specific integrase [Sphingobacterium faecium]|uniref:site-specific integrase n=1 Tax=Sphingobacterium faecium TaxID=34087 RepID=UPI00246842B8|nr:site-specific integrase [Sphingobacterium faecium]MDH5825755.1 site-specific integrase [Sphingobacterium faecium]